MVRVVAAAAALAALAALVSLGGCGTSSAATRTITVGGDKVTTAHLADAAGGLCHARAEAATDPVAARAAFYDRSHDALHTVARGLETVDRSLAADLLVAMQKVESELETKPPGLAGDLGALADVYRSGLRRLAIAAPPCVE